MSSAHLWAKRNIQCGAPRANWDAAHLARCQEKKMEVVWAYQQNATDIRSKSSHALDPSRKQEEGTTKRDVEKIPGTRNKGSRVVWGQIATLAERTDHGGVPRCRPHVRARTKRTK